MAEATTPQHEAVQSGLVLTSCFCDTDIGTHWDTQPSIQFPGGHCFSRVEFVSACSNPFCPIDFPLRLHEGAAGPSYKIYPYGTLARPAMFVAVSRQ